MRLVKWIIWETLLLVLVLGTIIVPHIKYTQQEGENRAQIEQLEGNIEALGEGIAQQMNLARWYNYNLDMGTPGLAEAYGSILNLGDGMMAALEVPELSVRLPIFHGGAGIAGHFPQSHLPIGGRESHTVLTLKGWYPWKKGMAVYIDCLNQRSVYRVESVQVMKAGWTWEWPSRQERLTIFLDFGGLRTIVRCVRCGELNVRKAEEGMPWTAAAVAAKLIYLAVLPAKLLNKRKRTGACRQKYRGFSRKNRRKTKLL